MADEFELGGLGGMSSGGGLNDLSGSASMKERDAANMADQDMSMGFDNEPQSLSDVATQGMGEGLSAMKEGLGSDDGGLEIGAALADEEEDEPIHAALEDEEEEAPIRAGRSEEAPKADYTERSSFSNGMERSSFDSYGLSGGADLSQSPSQNIDDIFIAGSYNRSSSNFGGVSSTGGTMYDPSKEKTDVNVSFGLPPIIKKLIILVVFVAAVLGILKYGFHVHVENYYHPQDVQTYVDTDAATVAQTLGVTFKQEDDKYSSEVYDYTLNCDQAGGLRLVNYNGKRLYIQVTGLRIDYSIFGVRPQITKFADAIAKLGAAGYIESKDDFYSNEEEFGSQGEEHVFIGRNGDAVIVAKKQQYQAVKSIKYVTNYKKFKKQWDAMRGIG